MPLDLKTAGTSGDHQNEETDRAESCYLYHSCTMMGVHQGQKGHTIHYGSISQNLGPFMVLPATGPAQTEAMGFFEYISIKHLSAYRPDDSWRNTLMFFAQTVPSVRYAAAALALMQRSHLERDSDGHVPQSRPLKDRLSDTTPLLYYNRAIQLLLDQEGGDNTKSKAITLLVCYLFTCFDHLAGNYVQAMKHLRGGVELSRNMSKYDDAVPSEVGTLIYQVTRQIRRLDMQAVAFLLDWTPADMQKTPVSRLSSSESAFESLGQAADHLQFLIAWVMRLRNAEQQMEPMTEMPLSPSAALDIVYVQLETWSSLFESMLQQTSSYETNFETYRQISMLRLQYTVIWVLHNTYGSGREMDYDSFLPQFQQCVALAGDVAAAHEWYSGSLRPTFTPEVGIVPVLYIVGVKCRDLAVRRKVLSILRRQPMREAIWDSISAARVVERVIDIEEGGSGGCRIIQSMEEIAVWQRIETVSWVHVKGHPKDRLDMSYTFCTREGVFRESLVV